MAKAIASYQILIADLQNPNSQLSKHVRKFTEFLGNMNDEKNLGFYVDRRKGLILKPAQISSSKYRYWQEFQEDLLESTRIMLREGVDPEIVQAFKTSRKVIIKRLRALKSKKDRQEVTKKQGVK